jgi:hypothetical protein
MQLHHNQGQRTTGLQSAACFVGSHGCWCADAVLLLWLCHAGQNEQVRIALGQPPIRGRGLRVLAMDGGGMKVGAVRACPWLGLTCNQRTSPEFHPAPCLMPLLMSQPV